MRQDQAEQEITDLLIGKQERTLTPSQRLLLIYANDRQQVLQAEANAIQQRATAAMVDTVMAIRKDIGVPVEVPITFLEVGEDVIVRWPPPLPTVEEGPQAEPLTPGPGLAIVKDEVEPAPATEAAAT